MLRLLSVGAVLALVLAAASAQGASQQLPGLLVYSSARGPGVGNLEIYALSLGGSSPRDLTRNQGSDGGPSVSPDGRHVAFWAERLVGGQVVRGLFVMRSDGAQQRLVTPPDLQVDSSTPPSWSSDNRRLAFTALLDQRVGVRVVGRDGSGLRSVAENAADPHWEPHGARLAFSARVSGEDQVSTLDVESGARTVVGSGSSPAWSPDGRSIAFVHSDPKTFRSDLFVGPADGSARPMQLTHVDHEFGAGQPSWSPNGTSITFTFFSFGPGSAVYTIRPDGSQLTRLSDGSNSSWSPSGSKIAFIAASGAVRVMRADGTDLRQLRGHASIYPPAPAWSRDGKRVLVQHLRYDGQFDLFVSNGDGTGRRRLMRTPQDEFLPAWSPDRSRIAFVRGQRSPSIWVVSRSGRGARRLHWGTYPSWSRNGTRLAYEDGGLVYTMNDRGAESRLIGPGAMPSWSPNGKSIALLRGNVLVVVDLRTHRTRTLDDLSCELRGEDDVTDLQPPEWSPRSTKLAITRICDYGPSTLNDAWVIDAATGVQWDIDAGAGTRSRLAWSPNGRWLAFTTEYWDERIVASRVYESTTRRISVSTGGDSDLDWR